MQSVKLTASQKTTHYLLPLITASMSLIFLAMFATGWLSQFITPVISVSAAILFLVTATIAFIKQHKALYYHPITTHNTAKVNAGLIKTILREHGWQAVDVTNDIIQAKGHGFRHKLDPRTWAELMTFKLDHNEIKVNSICDPAERAQFFDFGKNKQNIEDFERLFLNTPVV